MWRQRLGGDDAGMMVDGGEAAQGRADEGTDSWSSFVVVDRFLASGVGCRSVRDKPQ
jgi:hypothetical protein